MIDSPEEPGSSTPARGEHPEPQSADAQPSLFEGSAPGDDPPGSGPPPADSPPATEPEPWPPAEPPAAEPPATEPEPWPPAEPPAEPVAAEPEPWPPAEPPAEPVAAEPEPWPPAEPVAAEPEPWPPAEPPAPEAAPLPIAVEEPPLPPAEPAAAEPAAAAIAVGAAPAGAAAAASEGAAAPEARKPGITIGSLAKPRGGPKVLITRIGLLLVGLLILATIIVGGITVISKLHSNPTSVATGGSPTPSTAPGIVYFKYSDPKNQFSIDRPADWTARTLDQPDPNVVLLVGPPTSAYSIEDLVSVQIHPLPMRLGKGDLVPFKESIQQGLQGQGDNIIDFSPTPVIDGMVGWYFLYTYPGTNPPTGLHASYYLIDGDREILLTLQVQPYNDNVGFTNLYPIFQHMAQSLVSFYTLPSSGASTAPSSTVTPSG